MKNKVFKYICILFSFSIAFSVILSVTAYILDPQNVYRWNESGKRYFSPKYSTASSIKNYDYDLAIIGSSMVQNIDAESFAEAMDCKPLKLTIGAMTPSEILWVYNCANEQDKANTYIINIDLHRFTSSENVTSNPGRFLDYTYKAGGISQFKYLLGYETWFRFIPLSLTLTVIDKLRIDLPNSFNETLSSATDINAMCEFDITDTPGEDKLYESFNRNVKEFNDGGKYFEYIENSSDNLKYFLKEIEKQLSNDETLILLLPPYSVLYWANQSDEQQQLLFDLREQIANFADKHQNIRLLDLQSKNYTRNLNKYLDSSHFGAEILELVVQDIYSPEQNSTATDVAANSLLIKEFAEHAKAQAELRKQN